MNDDLNNFDFAPFFNERVKECGLNLKKISELTGITLKHLNNLGSGNFKGLPPAPYLRGYLKKLGLVLGFDDEEWWIAFKKRGLVKDSSSGDDLPKNRFTRPSLRKIFLPAVLILIILLYFIFQFPRIFGKPIITVTDPSRDPMSATSREYVLRGILKNADSLYVNDETVSINQDGTWEKNILLNSGLNPVEIRAKKLLGGETKIVRQIFYQVENSAGP